jgi:hypothetical protein
MNVINRLTLICVVLGAYSSIADAEAVPGNVSSTCDAAEHQAAETTARRVRVFDGTLFRSKPDLSAQGVEHITIHYGEMWKSAAEFQNVPDNARIQSLASKYNAGEGTVVLDIEQWPLRGDPHSVQDSLSKLKTVLARFKQAAPDKKFGLYGVFPLRDYWRAVKGPDTPGYREWQSENDRIRSLEQEIDLNFPSLYTFYPDQVGWKHYAIAQICEARRISRKPVFVFLWPEYHDSNKTLKGTYIGDAYWRMELETAWALADGIVIWGGYDLARGQPKEWDDGAPWWRVTKDVLDRHKSSRH